MTGLIVAIDTADPKEAVALISKLRFHTGETIPKFGLTHFWNGLPIPYGLRPFIDAKLKDTPRQVAGALKGIINTHNPRFITICADSGRASLVAAREAVDELCAGKPQPHPKLLAVTVLTSVEPDAVGHLAEIGVYTTLKMQILRLTKLAVDCGMDGVVCSGEDCADIKRHFGDTGLVRVAAGVDALGHHNPDQKRAVTVGRAVDNGADWVVVGSAITSAADPVAAMRSVEAELHQRVKPPTP